MSSRLTTIRRRMIVVKRWLADHGLTTLVTITAAVLIVKVPQVHRLLIDTLTGSTIVGCLTIGLLIWSGGLVARFIDAAWTHRWADRSPRWSRRLHESLIVKPLGIFLWAADRGRVVGESRFAIAVSMAIALAGLATAAWFPVQPSGILAWNELGQGDGGIRSWWPQWGGFVRILAIGVTLVAAWLMAGKWYGPALVLGRDRGDEEGRGEVGSSVSRGALWQRTGEVLAALFWLMILLEAVWVVASGQWFGSSGVIYTVWGFAVLVVGSLILSALVDFLDRQSAPPWRLLTLGLGIGLMSYPSQVTPGDAHWLGDTGLPATESIAGQMTHTTAETNPPAWIVAAGERLDASPDGPVVIVAASGGGSRAAMATEMSMKVIRDLLRSPQRPGCLWLCCGISGGGVALAAGIVDTASSEPAAEASLAMAEDFLAPVLRGLFIPFHNRGESLTLAWDRRFAWNSHRQRDWASSTPMLVLGGSDIDRGRRAMIGFPPLPSHWYPRHDWTPADDGQGKPSTDLSSAPFSMSSLLLGGRAPNVTLGRAARITSSFPFGFEPTRMTVDSPNQSEGATAVDSLHFLDGGMIDNTGLDCVAAIIERLTKDRSPPAMALTKRLRRRGVLLIEVAAGLAAGEVASSGPLHRLTQPIAGYQRGVSSAAIRARTDNLRRIETSIRGRTDAETAEVAFAFEDIRVVPANDDVDEVMTTFSLPQSDIRRLIDAFDRERATIRDAMEKRYDELTSGSIAEPAGSF